MTVTISLLPETERKLREQAARARESLETYLERLAVSTALSGKPSAVLRTADEWVAEWRAWAASHRVLPEPADDDRESIYADRGE